ncbi:DNA-binding protein [Pasteurella multocida]|uniref:DNA-binding protein n=1 Tax=Pasteurella multocida TaxID=747 RepID=UPI0029B9E73C|nr:DNA-binding protein [Pasteurella multocida]MDX3950714.1 DNA-binding protein [Pasteurella multocida]
MIREWFEIKELLGVGGLATTVQGITKKAKKENWRRRRVTGVKGNVFEYYVKDMPLEVQKALGLYEPMTVKEAREMNHPSLGKAIEALDIGGAMREFEAILNRLQPKLAGAVPDSDFPVSWAERVLIENYRKASDEGKEAIENVAETMAAMQEKKEAERDAVETEPQVA